MILSDKTILEEIGKKRIIVEPFDKASVGPSSIDLHLARQFRVFKHINHPVIDVREKVGDYTEVVEPDGENPFILHPHEFVLGSTVERIGIPSDLIGRLDGKSSLGRHGIIVHATAGSVHPGWEGTLTLEINNVGKIPVALYPGMEIAQISFEQMTTPALRPYGTRVVDKKYQGQSGPTQGSLEKLV